MDGRYYAPELQKIVEDEGTSYRIEKVYGKRLRNGKKELLVKFIGYKDKEWILQENVL